MQQELVKAVSCCWARCQKVNKLPGEGTMLCSRGFMMRFPAVGRRTICWTDCPVRGPCCTLREQREVGKGQHPSGVGRSAAGGLQ